MLIDIYLGLIFAISILILGAIVFGIMLISIALQRKTQAKLDVIVSKVRGNYSGTRVIRAFTKENDEISDFDEKISSLNGIQKFAGRISALMNPLTYVVINAAVIILIRNGAINVDSGTLTQGELVALYNYMSQILVELIKLASLIITLNKASASAKRISDVLNTVEDVRPHNKASDLDIETAVRFDNVSFRYGDNTQSDYALDGISFDIKRGQTVGIIGGTGSGKSTLANLIPGFYSPTVGEVCVNGKDTSTLSPKELKDIFGIVPQKPTLFSGTVRSNLQWGKDDATEEEMWNALEKACAKDFIEQKEKALDEPVLQGGSNFSGGQRQRLTIARALIKSPDILILDDSSSALDYATEASLRKNIQALEHSPTVFIISQRASSVMHADLIIVLEDGRAVGIGNHAELLEQCEVYSEIYNSQFSKGGDEK
jgi:ABC-type multidrug transport system fused ATPase/permease subunit